jgi:hypothetical protein
LSSPATGSLYSLITFAALGGAFVSATSYLWGWSFPSPDRLQTSVTLMYLLASGGFAMLVGRHRDVTYFQAVGRALKGLVMR